MPNGEGSRHRKELGQEIGRILGVLAREDPELYTALKEYAEREGIGLTEAALRLLKKQFLMERVAMEGINVNQLLTAWDILRQMLEFAAHMYSTTLNIFLSESHVAIKQAVEERAKETKAKPSPLPPTVVNELIMPLFSWAIAKALEPLGFKMPQKKVPVSLEVK